VNIVFLLVPLSLVLIALIVWALVWAVRSGQFDDLDSPGWRILMDDDEPPRRGPEEPPEEQGGSAGGEGDRGS